MSQPKRYNLAWTAKALDPEQGAWVEWDDYAALAAEKEALVQQGIRDHGDWRSKLNFLEADYKAEVAALAAENERLRKAGDAMADDLRSCQMDDGNKLLVDWNAAKEGASK